MGKRHGNQAPVPKTTWAISLEVDEMVSKFKGRHNTIDDFIKKVFEQSLEWKDTISFYGRSIHKTISNSWRLCQANTRVKETTTTVGDDNSKITN